MNAGFHIYGMESDPGRSIKTYLMAIGRIVDT